MVERDESREQGPADLLIREVILEGAPATLEIRGGVIRRIHRGGEPRGGDGGSGPAPRLLDGSGLHAFPSLRNGHTHAAMTLFRGWGDDLPLMDWLQTRIWPAEARMTPEQVYAGTRLALLEMIRSGTTYLNDMYWHAGAVARAVEEMGLRAHIGAVFIDLGSEETGRRWRREVEGWLERIGDLHPRLRVAIAPHAIYTVSPGNLRWLGERAREHDLVLHIHLSETEEEVERCVAEHGVRPTRHLERLGLVGPDLVAAHGVYLDREELELLGAAGATVVTNPAANLKLATGGIMDYPGARAAGVRVALGTDGAGSNNSLDLLADMKLAALLQKHRARDATVLPAAEALALATTAPAEAFGPGRGTLAEGEPADLMLVDLSGPETAPGHDPVSDLVYAANGSVVHTTICDGRVLMHRRKVEGVDPEEVLEEARAAAWSLTGRG